MNKAIGPGEDTVPASWFVRLRAALAQITETYPPDTEAGRIAADTLAEFHVSCAPWCDTDFDNGNGPEGECDCGAMRSRDRFATICICVLLASGAVMGAALAYVVVTEMFNG